MSFVVTAREMKLIDKLLLLAVDGCSMYTSVKP